MQTWQILETIR